jgi:hypoxanthine phosphoribosyltransferase
MSEARERLSWAQFGEASRALAAQIHDDGFEPDIILAIARGGLLIAGALGYALSVKNLYTMNVEYYTGVDERLDVPMILPPIPDPGFLANADVLIADDVADTGHTLAAVKEFCTGKVAAVRSAVLYEKPRSVVSCEYKWKTTDLWIEFPWSDKDPISHGKAGSVVRDA